MNQTIFILDTNVLLHDPKALFNFSNCIIYLHAITITELESFKKETSERGYNARENIRIIDSWRQQGSLIDGIEINGNSILKLYFSRENEKLPGMQNDDLIIKLAENLIKDKKNEKVILISKDFAMRIKASLLGITVNDYQSETVSKDNFYQGWKEFIYPSGDIKNSIEIILKEIQDKYIFTKNEFALIVSQHKDQYYRLFRFIEKDYFIEVNETEFLWGVEAKNPHQKMIINLLLDDSIQFITLFGPSGTGKTFLVLATMLYKVLCEKKYQKLIVSRPIVPLGNDIGYLPGDLYEKLQSWMQPIRDNLEFLLHNINNYANGNICMNETSPIIKKKYYHKKGNRDRGSSNNYDKYPEKSSSSSKIIRMDDLVGNENKVSLEAITYMRGRSIPFQIIFIDEVQNLTPHEVKTLISRAGEGTKVILVGDPYQIDSPYLDFVSNGLVVASEKFKGQAIFGSIYLHISERSQLSALANELM
jgi:PhoH-like ATPase